SAKRFLVRPLRKKARMFARISGLDLCQMRRDATQVTDCRRHASRELPLECPSSQRCRTRMLDRRAKPRAAVDHCLTSYATGRLLLVPDAQIDRSAPTIHRADSFRRHWRRTRAVLLEPLEAFARLASLAATGLAAAPPPCTAARQVVPP